MYNKVKMSTTKMVFGCWFQFIQRIEHLWKNMLIWQRLTWFMACKSRQKGNAKQNQHLWYCFKKSLWKKSLHTNSLIINFSVSLINNLIWILITMSSLNLFPLICKCYVTKLICFLNTVLIHKIWWMIYIEFDLGL